MSELRSAYEYTMRDLFAGPTEHYMYSPFGGSNFLTAYVQDRERHLARFDAAAGDAPSSTAVAMSLPAPDSADDVDTESLLAALAANGAAGHLDPVFDHWVDVVARKFEVAKRLRIRYTAALRVADERPLHPDAHAAAAFALAVGARRRSTLRLLNCLLKMNDHVCSSSASLSGAGQWYAAAAIRHELAFVTTLATRMSVALPGVVSMGVHAS